MKRSGFMNGITPIVYHYCSLESFLSIISNSTIRLSNISKSNDKDEIRYCFDIFEKTLKEACKEFSKNNVDNPDIKRYFNEIDYNSLVTRAVKNDSLIYYVACFSEESDLLSQWRGYADDGKGVAIGFYSHYFVSAKDLKNIKYNKIIYDAAIVENDLKEFIVRKLLKAKKRIHDEHFLSPYEDAINDVISAMVYNAVFYKSPAFKEENEWRLVFYPFGNIRNLSIDHKSKDMAANQLFYDRMYEPIEYKKDYNGLERGKLQFKCTDDKIVSFIDICFNSIKELLLAEIVIGPKANIDDKDLRLFLISNGYDLDRVNIRKSRASYQ
jgi:hypothetical protein